MSMPFYVSPEQLMQDKAEYARKGIARGKSIVALEYDKGIVLVAENPSRLTKISEIYDRIAFAGVGRFSEFDQLRKIGVRFADVRGYAYSREDVRGKALANAYSQAIGDVFTRELKPLEVEVIVAEVGDPRLAGHEESLMFRVTFDGSISDHRGYTSIGGGVEALENYLRERYRAGLPLGDALKLGRDALLAASNGATTIPPERLEVCTLDRDLPGRKFRRASAEELRAILG
jgi:proteasome alpha subunit